MSKRSFSILVFFSCIFFAQAAHAQLQPPQCPTGYQEVVLNFDTDGNGAALPAGTVINNQYANHSVTISAQSNFNLAIVFDSNCPGGCTGGDIDLGSPNSDFGGPGIGLGGRLGQPGENNTAVNNILILSDKPDVNNDGLVENPGDDAAGGEMIFDFGVDVRILSVDFLDLDLDQNESLIISGFQNAAPSFTPVAAPNLGDNAFERVWIYENNLSDRLEILYGDTSGAVAEVRFCKPQNDCLGVPGGNATVDDCGVCAGNNLDKDDCGVCFGNNQAKDDCGVCFGQNAAKDECGVCFGQNQAKDDCGVCFGQNAGKDDCGVCFGENQDKDSCGICFGNNTSCVECLSPSGGQGLIDDCGVCNGNNQDRDDCGVCFGNNQSKDDCGVCNGQNTAKDDCGVCFGDNSAKDDCGVCFGDSSSCIECNDVNITQTQFALDGLGESQFRLLAKTVLLYRSKSGARNALQRLLDEGKNLKLNGWTAAWSLPGVIQTGCSNTTLCVSVDNTSTFTNYSNTSDGLDRLIKKTLRKLNRKFGSSNQTKKLERQRIKLSNQDQKLLAQIPVTGLSCNN